MDRGRANERPAEERHHEPKGFGQGTMTGETHRLVAELALARLPGQERVLLAPRWDAIEAGATLSDDFRIMWEPTTPSNEKRQLVHRCYVDSQDPKDHGCIIRALDHATGSVAFIEDFLTGTLETYTQADFLDNLGMFLGVASHHIADLCTPIHVGQQLDHRALGFRTRARFHTKVERDIERHALHEHPKPKRPVLVPLEAAYFWQIARTTYKEAFLHLEAAYRPPPAQERIAGMARTALTSAVRHTANVWHTILAKTRLVQRSKRQA